MIFPMLSRAYSTVLPMYDTVLTRPANVPSVPSLIVSGRTTSLHGPGFSATWHGTLTTCPCTLTSAISPFTLFATPFYWITTVWQRRLRISSMAEVFRLRYESRPLESLYALIGIFYLIANISLAMEHPALREVVLEAVRRCGERNPI